MVFCEYFFHKLRNYLPEIMLKFRYTVTAIRDLNFKSYKYNFYASNKKRFSFTFKRRVFSRCVPLYILYFIVHTNEKQTESYSTIYSYNQFIPFTIITFTYYEPNSNETSILEQQQSNVIFFFS